MKTTTFLSLLVSVVLMSCVGKPVQDERVVTVTIEPLRYFTEQIAGDKFKVVTMVPKGGNPETYEPSTKQMMDLSVSDVYIKVGNIGFERTWMQKLEANAPHSIIVDSSEGVTPLRTPHDDIDPHTWMSVVNARIIARNICQALVQIDSKDSIYFQDNLKLLLQQIDDVDASIRKTLTESKTRSFLIYHPVLTYFAHDYNLNQIAMEEEGREPSASQLKNVIMDARSKGVKIFFVQSEFANRNIDIVAEETQTTKTAINPLGYNWTKEMLKVAQSLR